MSKFWRQRGVQASEPNALSPSVSTPPVINLTTDINTNPGHGFVELVLARPNVSIIHHINGFVTLLH